MKVLSLFDGIACGKVALERAGIPVEKYYASEIDKYAIQVAMKNHPDIIQLGDVTKIDFDRFGGQIDLLIAGSPCQGFSFAGKQLNFEDPRSKLFFEFVRALKVIKPKYFLLENVKMKKEYEDIISAELGVKPVEINSSLVSAQNRKRLYWANWDISKPVDKGILLKDIVHENTHKGYIVSKCGKNIERETDKASCLMARDYKGFGNQGQTGIMEIISEYIVPFDQTLKILDKEVEKGKIGYFRKDCQSNRVYYIHGKAGTICGDAGGGAAKMGQYLFGHIQTSRGKNDGGLKEREKSPSITSNAWEQNNHLLFGCITPDRINKRQNGQRFSEGQKFYTLTAQDRHGVLIEGYIRKLTPTECERLQTLPDGYTEGVSNSQRYKMLGNGWTVDVLAHAFGQLKTQKKEREEQMSNFICSECGTNHIDCGYSGFKTVKELRYEKALHEIIVNGPACQHDQECPLHNGDGFDQGCAACSVVLATEALKEAKVKGGIAILAPNKQEANKPQRGTISALAPKWNKK